MDAKKQKELKALVSALLKSKGISYDDWLNEMHERVLLDNMSFIQQMFDKNG